MNLKTLCFGGVAIEGFFQNLVFAILRGLAGVMLVVLHGWEQFPVSHAFADSIGHIGFPVPTVFAWFVALAEVIGGGLVALGLATRPAALCATIAIGIEALLPGARASLAVRELPLLLCAVFLVFTVLGAGRMSFDAGLRGGK